MAAVEGQGHCRGSLVRRATTHPSPCAMALQLTHAALLLMLLLPRSTMRRSACWSVSALLLLALLVSQAAAQAQTAAVQQYVGKQLPASRLAGDRRCQQL